MKSGILLVLIILFFLAPLVGQSFTMKDRARFTAIISFTDHPNFRQKGKLYDTYDSAIALINPYSYKTQYRSLIKTSGGALFVPESELIHIQVNRVDHVYLRKDGNIIKGILAGAVVGMVTGIFIGNFIGNDPSAPGIIYTENEKSARYGVLLGLAGGLTGGIIGANIRVEIPIGARQQEYWRLKPRLDIYKLSAGD